MNIFRRIWRWYTDADAKEALAKYENNVPPMITMDEMIDTIIGKPTDPYTFPADFPISLTQAKTRIDELEARIKALEAKP